MKVLALLGVTAVALIFGAGALAQTAPESPGPAVGARVPDFQLSDQAGANRSLHSVMGPKGLMLVFFRSADW
jgi:hypothetical protein